MILFNPPKLTKRSLLKHCQCQNQWLSQLFTRGQVRPSFLFEGGKIKVCNPYNFVYFLKLWGAGRKNEGFQCFRGVFNPLPPPLDVYAVLRNFNLKGGVLTPPTTLHRLKFNWVGTFLTWHQRRAQRFTRGMEIQLRMQTFPILYFRVVLTPPYRTLLTPKKFTQIIIETRTIMFIWILATNMQWRFL